MSQQEPVDLTAILSDEHLRQRISPRPGDSLYLHLSDLLLALKKLANDDPVEILDFGAGISPYRSLFSQTNYKRADFALGSTPPDFVLDTSLRVGAPDNSFDLVLSTQVLEHVEQPASYLEECRRVLRPGGRLLLSTHGIYPDHPCPLDLHRWTADGLATICRQTGFDVMTVEKLTIGPRALLFLYDLRGGLLHRRDFSVIPIVFALANRLYLRFRPYIHRWADAFFPDSRVATSDTPGSDLYINIVVQARKPDSAA